MTPRRLAAVLIVFALIRMALTMSVFSETADEPTHVAAGLYIWTLHRCGILLENPPLVPLVLAAPLLLAGVKFQANAPYPEMLESVFHSLPHYRTSLVLARSGALLFYAIAALALWMWARRELGDRGGAIALLLFTMEPILLGYSGLATHDGAAVAGVALSLFACSRWLEARSWRRALETGAAFGFAVLCKISCLVFVPAGVAAIVVVRLIRDKELRRHWRSLATIAAMPVAASVIVWAGYGFTVGPSQLPAPSFFAGLARIVRINGAGIESYAFGETTRYGWWWYFPVAVLLKTTLPLLALLIAGFAVTRGRLRGTFLECFAAGVAMLAPAMTSTLDIGVRYVLAVLVPWVIAAAAAAVAMFESERRLPRRSALLLIVAQIVISLAAHPDYFPYFNVLAGRDPSHALTDSNLDWGQDVLRLRDVVRRRKIEAFGALIFASPPLDLLGFPPRYSVEPSLRTAGWVAVSEHAYRMATANGRTHWLSGLRYERVGKSIRLYFVE
jgi:4-amino-4-deoxy-L-arabinose transferase-like glycosyltransferase